MPHPVASFALQSADVITFQRWLRMSDLKKRLAQRARILLLLNEGITPIAICEQLQITSPTVFKWRKRYVESGIKGLADLPRSGQLLKLGLRKSKKSSH